MYSSVRSNGRRTRRPEGPSGVLLVRSISRGISCITRNARLGVRRVSEYSESLGKPIGTAPEGRPVCAARAPQQRETASNQILQIIYDEMRYDLMELVLLQRDPFRIASVLTRAEEWIECVGLKNGLSASDAEEQIHVRHSALRQAP